MASNNTNLRAAKKNKNDEFYTRYEDIEAEVIRYKEQLEGKIVYLPCDSLKSEFWNYFKNNFEAFGLKKLIATHYNEGGQSYIVWIDGNGIIHQEDLIGDGDFRSYECKEILKRCDVVITNPPFSLFREFIDLIITHNKEFLIIGNKNAFTYQEIFRLIKNNQIWIGYTQPKDFRLEDGSTTKKVNGLCRWFTNLYSSRRNEELVLTKPYQEDKYLKYDNYEAINVDKVVDIPKDYNEIIGVPVTFLDKYNPNQFNIIGLMASTTITDINFGYPYINGKKKYARVLIKRK